MSDTRIITEFGIVSRNLKIACNVGHESQIKTRTTVCRTEFDIVIDSDTMYVDRNLPRNVERAQRNTFILTFKQLILREIILSSEIVLTRMWRVLAPLEGGRGGMGRNQYPLGVSNYSDVHYIPFRNWKSSFKLQSKLPNVWFCNDHSLNTCLTLIHSDSDVVIASSSLRTVNVRSHFVISCWSVCTCVQ